MSDFQHDIPDEYTDNAFDFGFTAADENELGSLLGQDAETTSVDEILDIQNKLAQIITMHSTCEGTTAVKVEYENLMKAKMLEVEKIVIPLLVNLRKNKNKDYLYWPGGQREAQCNLQVEKLLNITRAEL
ncbi:TPA: hypothetical protein HA278_06120 [Candidatus Woesearchaeota archaeon]|nr:hypothetical protein [Candidatus Woesearchaeota archaeon]|tara:strand:+ start:554 stop:943 length:390 start_codon:yes stop_codon:yes gene_type:complete